MKKEETVDFHLKWAWHSVSRMYNVFASLKDMTMSIGYVLLNIDLENGTPATKIGPSIGMEPRSLSRMLKNLEEKKWIYREIDPTDKRFVKVYLTELGKERRNDARKAVIAFNNKIFESIPQEKIEIFYDVITEISKQAEFQTFRNKEEQVNEINLH